MSGCKLIVHGQYLVSTLASWDIREFYFYSQILIFKNEFISQKYGYSFPHLTWPQQLAASLRPPPNSHLYFLI